ncbi:hypothetical protein [Cupriavidus basilensis]
MLSLDPPRRIKLWSGRQNVAGAWHNDNGSRRCVGAGRVAMPTAFPALAGGFAPTYGVARRIIRTAEVPFAREGAAAAAMGGISAPSAPGADRKLLSKIGKANTARAYHCAKADAPAGGGGLSSPPAKQQP